MLYTWILFIQDLRFVNHEGNVLSLDITYQ